MKTIAIAMICHAINAAYCHSLGDDSQLSWDEAPQAQRDSAVFGVELNLSNPDTTPEQNHISWYKQKEAEGWSYGEVKDFAAKTHPCFVPYDELPQEQKSKDYLFRAVVHAVKDLPDTADHHALLTQLLTLQNQVKQYQTVTSATAQQSTATSKETGVLIRYIGTKAEVVDRMYESNVRFVNGQAKVVPKWLAAKLLSHPEYEEVQADDQAVADATLSTETEQSIESAQVKKEENEREEDAIYDARQVISRMTDKESLAQYAMSNFNQKMAKNQSVEWMQNKLYELIDQQGVPH